MIMKLKFTALAMFALIFISACVPKPTTVSTNLTAGPGANGGLPVKATVFYLTSTAKFNSADYFTLVANPEAVLGADLLKTSSVLLSPGQSKPLNASFEGTGPSAVGVVVGFKAIASAKWNATTSIKSGAENLLTVSARAGSLRIRH